MTGEPKRDLRLRILDARRAMTDADRAEQDALLRTMVGQWLDRRPDAGRLVLAGYAPIPNEPGGPDLAAALAGHAGRMIMPIWRDDNDLDWADYVGHLAANGRRPREPSGPRLGQHTIEEADVVIVPALAVDRTGMRLGRGGGSYDRALARLRPEAVALALLYPGEILTEPVPSEPHDRRVHGAITVGGVVWFTPA